MRILVDGFNLSLERGTGIATYARNLTYNLKDLGHTVDVLYGHMLAPPKYPAAREMDFFDPDGQQRRRRRFDHLKFLATFWRTRVARPVPHTNLVIESEFRSRMPRYDRLLNATNLFNGANLAYRLLGMKTRVSPSSEPPDIAHWTCPLPIYMPGVKNIYTVHDLIPMRLPFTTLDHNQRFVRMVEWIAKTADHIVTVSETSKRDIVNLLGVPEEKVSTTYQSVEIPARYLDKAPDVVASEVKGIFGLDYKGYYLFFGAIEPKKNVGRLIQGYLASGVEEPLVVLGGDAWLADKELSLLAGDYLDHLRSLVTVGDITQTRRKVRRFSYAPFPILISLIKGAKAVVAPSLYEGFGLPALESMLCGTPVITTKEGASSEIVDDAALLVDPYDPNDIRDAILAMNNNPELSAELVQRGRRRAELFSAERYRLKLAELYARL
jgi:glycosyltransferase involved in cell wall biosynthesis